MTRLRKSQFQVGAKILRSEQRDRSQAISFLFRNRGLPRKEPKTGWSFLELPVCAAALKYSSLRKISGRYGRDPTVFISYLKTLTGCSAATIAMVLEMTHTISGTDISRHVEAGNGTRMPTSAVTKPPGWSSL
jgi:hypothetical protein